MSECVDGFAVALYLCLSTAAIIFTAGACTAYLHTTRPLGNASPRVPAIGETWALRDRGPWPSKCTVLILDVMDGWVRYQLSPEYFPDERLTLKIFLHCYTFVSAPNNDLEGEIADE